MAQRASAILDADGKPFVRQSERQEIGAMMVKQPRRVEARYDAASDSDEFRNYWAGADFFDADSANNQAVRSRLVTRSRYEIANNGYADGIAQTYAVDLIGSGPKLRMQTGSIGFNQLVEFWWDLWCKAVKLRRKLMCMAHAKHSDGEAIGVVRRNPGVSHPVKLDVILYETEQCRTPYVPLIAWRPGYIDGIKFDEFGNPEWYDILKYHPGGSFGFLNFFTPEQVPARFVLHWYKLRRPGQHRGVPECSSTLNTGAAARRWREATVGAAETAADIGAMLTTNLPPASDVEPDPIAPFSTIEWQKRMLMAAPMGWNATQMKGEHPNAQYEAFHKTLVSEQARPKQMPYNVASCDSSGSNYASGHLDHQIWYKSLDADRYDGDDAVLDPLFALWFEYAVLALGWLGGNPAAISSQASAHSWDWPRHPVVDRQTEAASNQAKLATGQTRLGQIYSENGEDFEDELPAMAAEYGVSVDEMRQILRTAIFNAQNQQASQQQADTQAKVASKPQPKPTPITALLAERSNLNGSANGHAHQ